MSWSFSRTRSVPPFRYPIRPAEDGDLPALEQTDRLQAPDALRVWPSAAKPRTLKAEGRCGCVRRVLPALTSKLSRSHPAPRRNKPKRRAAGSRGDWRLVDSGAPAAADGAPQGPAWRPWLLSAAPPPRQHFLSRRRPEIWWIVLELLCSSRSWMSSSESRRRFYVEGRFLQHRRKMCFIDR